MNMYSYLEKYCSAICNINGLMTYIISPEYYEAILSDSVLLRELSMREADLKRWVKIARKIGARGTYMAFVCHEAWIEHFRWVPVLCLKSGDEFFHVHYHDGWMCRECGCNNGAVIMPMPEADPIFYKRAGNGSPEIPPGFRKIPCKNCGKMLQNHLIQMEYGKGNRKCGDT